MEAGHSGISHPFCAMLGHLLDALKKGPKPSMVQDHGWHLGEKLVFLASSVSGRSHPFAPAKAPTLFEL